MQPLLYVCSADAEVITRIREQCREPVGVLLQANHSDALHAEAAHKLHVDALVRLAAGTPVVILPRHPHHDAAALVADAERVAAWHTETLACVPATLGGVEAAHMLARRGYSFGLYPVTTPAVAAAFREATIDAHHGQVLLIVPVGALYRAGYNGFAHAAQISEVVTGSHVPVSVVVHVETAIEYAYARQAGMCVAASPELLVGQTPDQLSFDDLSQGALPEAIVTDRSGTQSYAISSPLVDALLESLNAPQQ